MDSEILKQIQDFGPVRPEVKKAMEEAIIPLYMREDPAIMAVLREAKLAGIRIGLEAAAQEAEWAEAADIRKIDPASLMEKGGEQMALMTPQYRKLTPQMVEDVLLLVDIHPPTKPGTWTKSQLARAYDYAIRLHLRTSDNSRIPIPARPLILGRKP